MMLLDTTAIQSVQQPWMHYLPHAGAFLGGLGLLVKFGMQEIRNLKAAPKTTSLNTNEIITQLVRTQADLVELLKRNL